MASRFEAPRTIGPRPARRSRGGLSPTRAMLEANGGEGQVVLISAGLLGLGTLCSAYLEATAKVPCRLRPPAAPASARFWEAPGERCGLLPQGHAHADTCGSGGCKMHVSR